MGADTDELTWAAVLAGDARSFGLIWDRHHARVERHLIGLGCPMAEVEDLAAITFLELWRKRVAVRFVDGSLLPWLLVTACNVHRNAARGRARYRALLARLPLPEPAPDPGELAAEQDTAQTRRVRETLAASRPADRSLVALTALEGYTVTEAAAALGLTESAARMRLSRMRARLRAAPAEGEAS
ncbi:MAG TPA: RNA polymerase sigma factor [Microbacteriaceae bacterium]|nr:RNA polymerase sigma factor [Microbacteriaceae bacterium]